MHVSTTSLIAWARQRSMTGTPAGEDGGGGAAPAERAALLASAERKLSKRILPCLSLLSII